MTALALCVCLLLSDEPPQLDALPRPSEQGGKELSDLVQKAIEGHIVTFLPRGRLGKSRMIAADPKRVRDFLIQNQKLITSELCDELLATSRGLDDSVLLSAIAELKNDDRMRAFAALARGNSFTADGNLPDAAKAYAEAADRFARRHSSWQATSLLSLAQILSREGNFDQSLARCDEAVAILRKSPTLGGVAVLSLLQLAETYHQTGRIAAAEKTLDDATQILASQTNLSAGDRADIFRRLGSTCERMGKYEAAEAAVRKSLKACQELPKPSERLLETALSNSELASIAQVQGRTSDAERILENCLRDLDTCQPKPNAQIATVLRHLGTIYYDLLSPALLLVISGC